MDPFPDPSWKRDARAATFGELPRIRSTGLEVGPLHGLGGTIYGNDDLNNDGGGGGGGGRGSMRRASSWGGGIGVRLGVEGEEGSWGGDRSGARPAAAKLRKGGKWLGELDVRRQLFAKNPLLKR